MTHPDQRLGKYRLLEPLGSGGMAQVYRALQPPLNRAVAIKVLRPELADRETVTRLRREAQALAAIRHPNVVQVLDFDEENGRPFLVMELIDGTPLEAVLATRRAPLPLGEAARIVVDVLAALETAHQAGVIHRDLKPANLMLTRSGATVVTDFGIAVIVDHDGHTRAGALMGTLLYMAPELGLHGQASPSSDLYALGVVFYQLVTGRVPFSGPTPLATVKAHAEAPLPAPETLNPTLPEAVTELLRRALAKSPADRFASAADMRQALEMALVQAGIALAQAVTLPVMADQPLVLSGADRQWLAGSAVTEGDTAPDLAPALGRQTVDRSGFSPGQAVFLALSVFFLIHTLGVATAGMLGRLPEVLGRAWPVEILWLGLLISLLQLARPRLGLFIPAVLTLTLGAVLSYFTLTQRWHEWWWWLFALVGLVASAVVIGTRLNHRRALSILALAQIALSALLGFGVLAAALL